MWIQRRSKEAMKGARRCGGEVDGHARSESLMRIPPLRLRLRAHSSPSSTGSRPSSRTPTSTTARSERARARGRAREGVVAGPIARGANISQGGAAEAARIWISSSSRALYRMRDCHLDELLCATSSSARSGCSTAQDVLMSEPHRALASRSRSSQPPSCGTEHAGRRDRRRAPATGCMRERARGQRVQGQASRRRRRRTVHARTGAAAGSARAAGSSRRTAGPRGGR